MKRIVKVAAAIIQDGERILAMQRGHGEFAGMWEFPGGKVETGETSRNALEREIQEEMDARIQVEELFYTVEYNYPDFHLSMDCFLCTLLSETWKRKEHMDSRWLTAKELDSVPWLPADVGLIERLKERMQNAGRRFGAEKSC